MCDTKENSINNNKNSRYTDLRLVYVLKTIVFTVIGIVTCIQSKNFDSLLFNALIYLVGICFDLFVSSKSNSGPVLKFRRVFTTIAFVFLFAILVAMIAMMALSEEIDNCTKVHITKYTHAIIVGFGIIGPMIELISNIPEND